MVYIPPGSFMMGVKKDDLIAPLHKVTLTKPYCIDRLEVTLDDYQKCEKARACTKSAVPRPPLFDTGGPTCNAKREGRGKHPVNCITWLQADSYCRWVKKRLPTEAEWEFAARGPKSFKWPWGDHPPTAELAWSSMYEPMVWGTGEVGRHPAGASPFGVLDMGGNVSEWVQDWDTPTRGRTGEDAVDPVGPTTGTHRICKDIGWDGGNPSYNVAHRSRGRPDEMIDHATGVRCALSRASQLLDLRPPSSSRHRQPKL